MFYINPFITVVFPPTVLMNNTALGHFIMIIIIIIHHEVVTSDAVVEQVRPRQSLSVIMSHVKQVSFKPRFENCR